MLHHTETILLHRGSRTLTVRQEHTQAGLRYVGRIDGRPCVVSPTRESAVCSLFRRLAYASVN